MNKVIVTTSWDDGHKLDLKVFKLLKKYALNGTFYIAPENREFDKSDLLKSEDITEIAKYYEIGAHTLTHPLLPDDLPTFIFKYLVKAMKLIQKENYLVSPRITPSYARKEIVLSKNYLENLTGNKIVSFCYPAGRRNSLIEKMVQECGFTFARTVDEYCFGLPKNMFTCGTSIHAFRHNHDFLKRVKFSHWNITRFTENADWEILAKRMFDHILITGGVFHLWGHSWLIEQSREWNKLENVFSYISNKQGIEYVTNSELTKYSPLEFNSKKFSD